MHVLLGKDILPLDDNPFLQRQQGADGTTIYYSMMMPLRIAAQCQSGFSIRVRLNPTCQLFETPAWR